MEYALFMLATGAVCIGCFFVGAKVGQKVVKGEEIQMPTVNPLEAYRQHREKQELQMEQDKMNVVLQNIENYDGTSRGQQDVPRG